jgi:hypothetical protein
MSRRVSQSLISRAWFSASSTIEVADIPVYVGKMGSEMPSCSILPLGEIAMRPLIFALCVIPAFGSLSAQKPVWQPSPGHTQIPIWPGAAPDRQPVAGPEYAEWSGNSFLPGGRQALGVGNVVRPTMTVYPPKGKNTGAAVVVFPGGGYQILAIDLEGTEVCDWLTPKGPRGQRRRLACLLHCAEERWRARGNAFVCTGRARVWTAANEVSRDGLASAGGDVAEDDWDDFGVGAPGLRTTTRPVASRVATE